MSLPCGVTVICYPNWGVLGAGGGGTVIMTALGSVGHTEGNDALQEKINELLQKRHGGGLNSKQRDALDKEINELKGKIVTNEKAVVALNR